MNNHAELYAWSVRDAQDRSYAGRRLYGHGAKYAVESIFPVRGCKTAPIVTHQASRSRALCARRAVTTDKADLRCVNTYS